MTSSGFHSTPPPSAQSESPPNSGVQVGYYSSSAHTQPMDGRQAEYAQPDQTAAQYQAGHDPRSQNFPSQTATPTSEYGIAPSSARSGSFPDYIQRPYQAPGGQGANGGGMAQATNPSIAAATSPTYPHQQQYSPYPPQQHDMHYQGHPGVYARPDWAGSGGQQHPGYPPSMPPYGHPTSSGPPTPAMVSPGYQGGHPLSTVYSFVPIPGAQQHKRPRRRYEEIERMYKCGWQGCEKAYGTLNHLNAHVTMQGHGQKRTPEEFKEIRKEWKAKKKEEEQLRKADEERSRTDGRDTQSNGPETPIYGHVRTPMQTPTMGGPPPQLPPIGYTPAGSQAPTYGQQSPAMEGMPTYPQSPYGQSNQHMYQQHADAGAATYQQ